MFWQIKAYWQYYFEDLKGFKHFWCRLRKHPCGPIYYNQGWEPDWRCINCGDYLN